jgi:hypothetical protein
MAPNDLRYRCPTGYWPNWRRFRIGSLPRVRVYAWEFAWVSDIALRHSHKLVQSKCDELTRDAHVALWDAQPQQPRVTLWSLHKVMSPRDHEEPLGVVVDDQVDHILEPGGDSRKPDERVRSDDWLVLVQAVKQRCDNLLTGRDEVLVQGTLDFILRISRFGVSDFGSYLCELVRRAERICITVCRSEAAPNSLNRASKLRRDPRPPARNPRETSIKHGNDNAVEECSARTGKIH